MFVIERAVKVVLLDLPQVVRDNSRLKFGVFHAGESENFNMHFRDSIREFQPVKAAVRFGLQWLWLRHHKAHAILGLYDSPFKRPVIISYDGFGEDGTFVCFWGDKEPNRFQPLLAMLSTEDWSLGRSFVRLGLLID